MQLHLWPRLSSLPFVSIAKGFIHKPWDLGFLGGCESGGVRGGVQSFGLHLMNQLSLRTSPGDSKCGGCEGIACLAAIRHPQFTASNWKMLEMTAAQAGVFWGQGGSIPL